VTGLGNAVCAPPSDVGRPPLRTSVAKAKTLQNVSYFQEMRCNLYNKIREKKEEKFFTALVNKCKL